jgi:hypothetical protein
MAEQKRRGRRPAWMRGEKRHERLVRTEPGRAERRERHRDRMRRRWWGEP